MKTTSTEKIAYSLARAREAAAVLVALLRAGCQRIEVAGSIRRGCATVHDIDLVVSAQYEMESVQGLFGPMQVLNLGPVRLLRAVRAIAELGDVKPDAKIIRFPFQGIPAELYLAEPDGSNFEALLQMRTGSRGHNAWLAGRAQTMKLYYHAGHGIYKLGEDGRFSERVDDGSEAGIYSALGLDYIQPERRG